MGEEAEGGVGGEESGGVYEVCFPPLNSCKGFSFFFFFPRTDIEVFFSVFIFYSFGITAFIFEMVPFASLAFSFTNTVGAALWAADIERKGMSTELREEARKMK